jgi:hypothetical protein
VVWYGGSAPYGSTQRCGSSGNEVMIASTPTTSVAQQPPTRICGAWGNQQVLHAPQHHARVAGHHATIGKTELPCRNTKMQSSKKQRGKRDVGPTTGSPPLLRWARGPLSVPCRPGTPAYKFQVKTKGETHVINLSMNRTARGSSGVAACPVAPAPTAQPGAALGSPRVLRLQLPLPGLGQLRGHHVSCGSSSCCPARGSLGAAT